MKFMIFATRTRDEGRENGRQNNTHSFFATKAFLHLESVCKYAVLSSVTDSFQSWPDDSCNNYLQFGKRSVSMIINRKSECSN